jgi:hypothetical protein
MSGAMSTQLYVRHYWQLIVLIPLPTLFSIRRFWLSKVILRSISHRSSTLKKPSIAEETASAIHPQLNWEGKILSKDLYFTLLLDKKQNERYQIQY